MKSNNLLPFLLAVCFFCFTACGGEAPKNNDAESTTENTEDVTPSKSEIKTSEFSSSPDFPGAKLELMGYENTLFNFNVSNYELKAQTSDASQKMCANSDKGQHIHLIVDDQPYAAKYESSFNHEVAEGEHYILAFLSRSYHESIKTADAHIAVKGTIQNNSMTSKSPIEDPMLFYSRPKGTYVGKANTDKVMLDFYLVNTNLAPDGNKVKVTVNGEDKFELEEWKPIFIEGLPMGDNKIKLTLIDNDGNKVDAPLNPVERVFTLKADPVE